MKEQEDTVWSLIGQFLAGILMLIGITLFRGYLLAKFWWWFIVPVFDTMPVTIAQAIGISMVISLFTFKRPTKTTCKIEEKWHKPFFEITILYLVIWFFGWVLTHFL